MAYTTDSDIAVLLNENGINKVFQYAKKQRPSLFNYGTKYFCDDPTKFCCFDSIEGNIPYADEIATLKIPRSNKEIEFCYQLKDFKVDYSPQSNQLPPPLDNNVPNNSFTLSIDVCVGFKFPDIESISCINFQIYSILSIERKTQIDGVILTPKINAIELVDISPNELESITESFLVTLLNYSIFPYLAFNTKQLAFNIGEGSKMTVELSNIDPNPRFEENFIKIHFNIK
jgi:hypothetical protein